MYQFPIFWPSEMIRKSKFKNQKSLVVSAKTKENEGRDNSAGENNSKKEFEENISNTERDLNLSKITKVSQREIFCEDLDGWDCD